MNIYRKDDLVCLAKRVHNTRRTYLLVNPLQGKHIPVSPSAALNMMGALGEKLAFEQPEIDLVIGFAETATAVAAAAAARMGHPCHYIHTTRESGASDETVEFREEHSHAVEQRLRLSRFRQWVDQAQAIALLDDELSTGRTMINAIRRLGEACPSIRQKPLTVTSLISRLGPDPMPALADWDIRFVSLVQCPSEDYTAAVSHYEVEAARGPEGKGLDYNEVVLPSSGMDAREGVVLPRWLDALTVASDRLLDGKSAALRAKRVIVLGTEEYMLPGLVFGQCLEAMGCADRVRFHATTRSPIGISRDEGYPIKSGWRLRSFYDTGRVTYIYNLEECDLAIVMTDSRNDAAIKPAMEDLTAALREVGCGAVQLIREECHVQHL